jgi:hypothetical protein
MERFSSESSLTRGTAAVLRSLSRARPLALPSSSVRPPSSSSEAFALACREEPSRAPDRGRRVLPIHAYSEPAWTPGSLRVVPGPGRLGHFGKSYIRCPAAVDAASGVTGAWELARTIGFGLTFGFTLDAFRRIVHVNDAALQANVNEPTFCHQRHGPSRPT